MANPTVAAVIAEIQRAKGLDASVVALINGFSMRLQAAVAAAVANGATEAELQPVTDEIASFKASNDAVQAALEANP